MNSLKKGILDGLPIGLGYLAVSFSFGILGTNSGLKVWQTVLISMINVTSAGQFAGLNIMIAMGSYVEMIISQLVINSRYSLMSVSLSQSVDKGFTTKYRILFGQFVTDEIFAVASSRGEDVGRRYFLGLCVLPYIGWSLGTFLGAVSGNILPDSISTSLNVALYGMFIAIFIPPMKKALSVTVVVLISVGISVFLYFQPFFEISAGTSVIICAVVASFIGAILFPVKDSDDASGKTPGEDVSEGSGAPKAALCEGSHTPEEEVRDGQ